jgi:hypothetical protein
MIWHLDRRTIARYTARNLSEAHAASAEAHLLACGICREALAGHVQADPNAAALHARTWDSITQEVDQPGTTLAERLMGWLGVPHQVTRLVAAAPALRQAWWIAGAGLLAVAVVVAQLGSGAAGIAAFLVGAPLVPLAGVALSYGVAGEPARDVAIVAPYSSFRLALLRTVMVLCTWLPAAALIGLGLPQHGRMTVLWLLPALAMCSAALAMSTYIDLRYAAVVIAAVWLVGAVATMRGLPGVAAADLINRYVAFRPEGQLALGALAVLALTIATVRRSAFDGWRTR